MIRNIQGTVYSHGLNVKYGPNTCSSLGAEIDNLSRNKTLKPFVPCCQHLNVRVALKASSRRPNWLRPSEPEAVLETVVE